MSVRTLAQQQAHERKIKEASRKAWLQSLLDKGMTQGEAARAVGCSESLMTIDVAYYGITGFASGIKVNGNPLDTEKLARVKSLIGDDLTVKELADQMGKTTDGMRSYLRRHGLKATPAKEKPKALPAPIVRLVRKLIEVNNLTPADIALQTGIDVRRIQNIVRASL